MDKVQSENKKRGFGQVEIIPAVNADTFEEVQRRVRLIESLSPSKAAFDGCGWAQIDAADGTFTKNTIWHNPKDLAFLETSLKIELHLMLDNMERRIEDWLLPNVHRIIFHISAANDPDFVIEKCRKAGKEAGIAIGPDESLTQALKYRDKVDMFQILAVHPGLPGQEAQAEAFERISELRGFCGECTIEVDGGMNKETAIKAVEAGANIIAAAAAIFSADDIGKAIKELRKGVSMVPKTKF